MSNPIPIHELLVGCEWKPFALGDLFLLERGREKKDTVTEGGKYPFVSAKISNNGVRMFVRKTGRMLAKNSISLNSNGDGGTGFGYYQPYSYAIDVNTTGLIPKEGTDFNQYSELFVIGCLGWLHEHFGNALPLSLKRATKAKIMLPASSDGSPDYVLMERVGKQLMYQKYNQYLRYLENGTE